MDDVYQQTVRREERLRTLGFTVRSVWEPISTLVTVFFGGRVGGYKLFREARADETIEYVDFSSLYPFVNKTKKYAVSHPTIIRANFQPISNYFGLIKCKVLAPANLYHLVLPVRAKGKLFFPLCKQCVMENVRFGALLPPLKC